jgi:hypothetical protein
MIIHPLLVVIITESGDIEGEILGPAAAPKSQLWDRIIIKSENAKVGNITALEYARQYFIDHVRAAPYYTHLIVSFNWDPNTADEQAQIYNQFFGPQSQLWTQTTFDHYSNESGSYNVFMFRQDFIMKNMISMRSLSELDTELLLNRRKAARIIDNLNFKKKFDEFREKGLGNLQAQERDALDLENRERKNIAQLARRHKKKMIKELRAKGKHAEAQALEDTDPNDMQPVIDDLDMGLTVSGKKRGIAGELLRRRKKEIADSQQVTIIPKGVDLNAWGSDREITNMPIRDFKTRITGYHRHRQKEIVL